MPVMSSRAVEIDSQSRQWIHASEVVPSGLPNGVWVRVHGRDWIKRRLRISLTERCNFSCFFCHNEGQGRVRRGPTRDGLTVDEYLSVIRAATSEGVTRLKLTGGEPLLYRSGRHDVTDLVKRFAALRANIGDLDISLTTNGSLLPEFANRLRNAGLDRVTISITTRSQATFRRMITTRVELLDRSLLGFRAARDAGLTPLKVNVALYDSVLRGVGNLWELPELLDVARKYGVAELRFLTLLWHPDFPDFDEYYQYFSPGMRRALTILLDRCLVEDAPGIVNTLADLAFDLPRSLYPKMEFGIDLGPIRLGFETMERSRDINRQELQEGPYAMRLGSDGALRPMLHGPSSYTLIQAVRRGASDSELRHLYRAALEGLP